MLLLDVKADDLDVAGGFDCLQLIVADTGSNAQLGSAIYLLYGPKVGQAFLKSMAPGGDPAGARDDDSSFHASTPRLV